MRPHVVSSDVRYNSGVPHVVFPDAVKNVYFARPLGVGVVDRSGLEAFTKNSKINNSLLIDWSAHMYIQALTCATCYSYFGNNSPSDTFVDETKLCETTNASDERYMAC